MNYIKIESSSLSNGTGWRVVLWCAGCENCCEGCQNRETWDHKAGKPFTEKEMELIMELLDHPFIQGLTFSGGDPLFPSSRKQVAEIARRVKERFPDKDIWLYTGYDYEVVRNLKVMKYVDYCVDGRYEQKKRDVSLAFRGSANQRIIDVANSKTDVRVVNLD